LHLRYVDLLDAHRVAGRSVLDDSRCTHADSVSNRLLENYDALLLRATEVKGQCVGLPTRRSNVSG
jgi:hypothetical protein